MATQQKDIGNILLQGILSGRIAAKPYYNEREEEKKLAEQAARNQLLNTGLGIAGQAGAAYLGTEAGGAALGSLFGGGATAAGATGGATAGGTALAAPTIMSAGTAGATAGGAGAGAGAGAAGAGSTLGLGSAAATLAPVVGALGGAYGAYQGIRGTRDVLRGDKVSPQEIWGTAIINPALALGMLGANQIKKGKHEHQKERDRWRDAYEEAGVIDESHNLSLADDTKFAMGRDGKNTLANTDGTNRRMYQTDTGAPTTSEDIANVDPFAELMTAKMQAGSPEEQQRMREQQSSYLTNAVQSGGDRVANAKKLYDNIGGKEQAYKDIVELERQGKIDKGRADAYLASLDRLFG
jgi:hypothetical protein